MIFKTFDSDIDSWTYKIGIFGKSFNELGTAVNNAFESVINNIDNFDENIGFLESLKNNLFFKKDDKDWIKNSIGEIISKENIDSYIKELDLESAKEKVSEIFNFDTSIKNGEITWEKYFDTCKGGNEYLIDLIKNTDDLSKLTSEDLVKANQQARDSALAHNEAIKAQTLSAKAGKVVLQALATVGNMFAGWLITKALQTAVTAFDNYIHRVEKSNEAMSDAVGEYESAKSKLVSVNSELEEQNKKIDELLSKDKLTYAEKEQLEDLQAITKELKIQQDIEEKRANKASKEAADKAVDAYNKQYGKYDNTEEDLQEKLSNENFTVPEDTDDVLGMIAAYVRAKELLVQSQKDYDEAVKNGKDTTWLAEDVQSNIDAVADYSQALDGNISDLQEKRLALADAYNNAIEKRETGVEPLTSSEKEIIETYESIYDIMRMVYEYTDPNAWKSMQIENVFDTEGIEKTKEELVEMIKDGTFDETTLQSYPKLSEALERNKVSAGELRNELEALAETEGNVTGDAINIENPISPLSISDTITQLDELKDKFGVLDKTFTKLSDKDSPIGFDDLSAINEAFSDVRGIDSYIKRIQDAGQDTELAKSAMEDLIDAYLNSSGILDNVNEANSSIVKSTLDEMGISNSQELVDNALLQNKAALIAATDEYTNAIERYKTATDEQKQSILDEIATGEQLQQVIAQMTIQKQLANENALSTANDVDAIISLAAIAGFGAEALYNLAEARAFLMEAEASGDIDQINEAKDAIKRIVAVEQKRFADMVPKAGYDVNKTTGTKSASNTAKEIQKEADIMSELKSEMDKLQSAYKSLCGIRDTYNEHGKITIDQYQELTDLGFGFLSTLVDENGQLGLNANAFEQLSNAKLQEMQIQLARNAVDTINGLKSEAEATEFLAYANEHLRDATLDAVEAQLYKARDDATGKKREAADMIVQGYEATKQLVGKVEFGFDPSEMNKSAEDAKKSFMDAYNEEKKLLDHMKSMGEINNSEYYERLMKLAERYFGGNEEYRDNLWEVQEQYHDYLESIKKTYNWIENLLSSLSKKTNALISKAEKFISWQKKNAMINRAIKASNNEITQNRNAYQIYMAKANSVGLSKNYVNKIQNGSLTIEDLSNEKLSGKIEKYQEWYDKAQAVSDTINDLYDKQRDLIRQKLDNVLDYYSDLDSYLSSVTSKIESIISLNNEMGKRTSLTELVEQFASLSDQLESVTTKKAGDVTTTEGSFGSSKKVAEAMKRDREELQNSIQAEIDNLAPKLSGTYIKLENDIAGTINNINKYVENGWDVTRSKQFDKLQTKLQNYYDLQHELDQYATSNTISNYSRVYTAYQKLQNKLDSGKNLTRSEQKRYDSYVKQIDTLREHRTSTLEKLNNDKAIAAGTVETQTEAGKIQGKIDSIQSDLKKSATYQNLSRNIDDTVYALSKYGVDEDGNGYDKLTQKQKKKYDNLQKQLKKYNAKKEALDENATASNVAEYSKVYDAWRKLQDKLDSGKNLSTSQWKKYNQYTEQLKAYAEDKADIISKLDDELAAASNPGDKLEQIERAYEESSKEIHDSYQKQIDDIEGDVTSTQKYKNLEAKAQLLEQKKKNRGLTKKEEDNLNKYNAELEALQKGGMSTNISDYMKTWELWYSLEKKLEKNGKLSDKDANKYDEYKAKLDAWNEEKQTQINDLLDLMENDLEALDKTYTENISEAESEINDYYANLYSLAKQIAEYNISSLQAQLTAIENCISYYKELVSLYDSFDGDKLVKILTDLGEIGASDEVSSRMDLYSGYLNELQKKYDTTLSEINEYNQLLGALDTGDFESSMDVFNKAMEGYKESGNTAMAEKLQSVLDLLNERTIDSDNWGEYADEWENEWNEAFLSAKQDLIGTAKEIQEVNDALREIRFEHITDAIDELEKASGILSSIEGLIKDYWLFEPDGSLSEYGRAKAALLVSQLEDAQAKANEYLNLYNQIQKNKDTYASEKDFKAASNEALQNYYDSLGNAASLENSILELMKKNSEEEINHLKDVIDARKQALQSKKEYYDYDKSIKNSQKEIDSLKAQRDAIKNLTDTTDAATKAKLAQLEAEIAEKEEALQESKDEHTFNLQIDALDKFSDTLTDALDKSAKSVEEIIKEEREVIESVGEMFKTTGNGVKESIDNFVAFYRGMGVTIDGMDLVPGTDISSDESTTNNTALTDLVPDNTKPSAVDKFIEEASEAFANGVLVRTSDTQMLKVYDQDMLAYMQEHFPSIPTAVQPIPQYIEYAKEKNDVSTVINNNHYDCLLKVEGNVDRNALPDLETILKESCRYTEADIYRQQMLLR